VTVTIEFQRLPGAEDIPLPRYQTAGAAGMDLHAAVTAPLAIAPGTWQLVPCGCRVAIPEGYEGQVRPRSGLAVKHGVTVLNAPGTVDSDYRGELKVTLINHGTAPFVVERGARIAQILITPVARATIVEVKALPETARAEGGFGHTGT
jgi:dUTP pyrophosphatase